MAIKSASVSGKGFSISGLTTPQTLTPKQSVTFTAKFDPKSAGSDDGNDFGDGKRRYGSDRIERSRSFFQRRSECERDQPHVWKREGGKHRDADGDLEEHGKFERGHFECFC